MIHIRTFSLFSFNPWPLDDRRHSLSGVRLDGVEEAPVVFLGADETDAVQGGVVHPPLVELHLRRQEAVPRDTEIWLVQLLICQTSRFLCTQNLHAHHFLWEFIHFWLLACRTRTSDRCLLWRGRMLAITTVTVRLTEDQSQGNRPGRGQNKKVVQWLPTQCLNKYDLGFAKTFVR